VLTGLGEQRAAAPLCLVGLTVARVVADHLGFDLDGERAVVGGKPSRAPEQIGAQFGVDRQFGGAGELQQRAPVGATVGGRIRSDHRGNLDHVGVAEDGHGRDPLGSRHVTGRSQQRGELTRVPTSPRRHEGRFASEHAPVNR
jgi:hypothetical protein